MILSTLAQTPTDPGTQPPVVPATQQPPVAPAQPQPQPQPKDDKNIIEKAWDGTVHVVGETGHRLWNMGEQVVGGVVDTGKDVWDAACGKPTDPKPNTPPNTNHTTT